MHEGYKKLMHDTFARLPLKTIKVFCHYKTLFNNTSGYFSSFSGTAMIIRADPGTENVKVEVLQRFFRANGQDSFMYGKSRANQVKLKMFSQRTPMYNAAFMLARPPYPTSNTSQWLLRNSETNWWMNFFKVDIPCITSKRQESNTPHMKFVKT